MGNEFVQAGDFTADGFKETEKLFKKLLMSDENFSEVKLPGEAVDDFYYKNDVIKNTVLIAGLGVGVRGNMQQILNELNYNNEYRHFKIYVRTRQDTDETVQKFIKQNNWNRTCTVSKGYYRKLETCEFLITESYFPYGWIKRPEQKVINLWHGTPLKCIGGAKNGRAVHVNGIQQKNFLYADYLLYPNEYTEEKMIMSYGIGSLLKGKAFMCGYPRTGGMLGISEQRKEEIRKVLAPNKEKVYVYMPTWKGYLSEKKEAEQYKVLLDYMEYNLRDDQILYVNLHHKTNGLIDYNGYIHVKQFPELIDSYELMTVSEAMISDYSSVFFDYLALGKQIVLDMRDKDAYLRHQGLYMDINELPFDKAYSVEEVLGAINRGKQYDDKDVRRKFCAYDTKENAQKVCQLLLGNEKNLCLHVHKKNGKRKVLIYSHFFKKGIATELLEELCCLKEVNGEADIYLSGNQEAIDDKEKDSDAYPMLWNNQFIGISNDEKWYSAVGKCVRILYNEQKISFDKTMEILKYDIALIFKRAYGDILFDTIWIYDASDPEIMISLAMSNAKTKFLFLTEHILGTIQDGNAAMRDAVCFCANCCNAIVVFGKEARNIVKDLFDYQIWKKIKVVECVEQLRSLLEHSRRNRKLNEDIYVPLMNGNRLMVHALGSDDNGGRYLNDEKAFLRSLGLRYKYFEVDLRIGNEDRLVCTYDANDKNAPDAEFLYFYMKDMPDIYLLLDLYHLKYVEASHMAKKILGLFRNDESIIQRVVIQVSTDEMFFGIEQIYNFRYYQYIVQMEEKLDKVIDFCVDNGITTISLKKSIATLENINKIKVAGLTLLVFTVNDIEMAKDLIMMGVDTICTDYIIPAMICPRRKLKIIYNSTYSAVENITPLLKANILRGELALTRSGAYEYSEIWDSNGNTKYKLMDCLFEKKGKNFKGWHIRTRNNKNEEWKYLCIDEKLYTKSQIEESGNTIQLFDQQQELNLEQFQEYKKIILVANWE